MLFNSFNFIFYFLPIAIFSYVLFILSRNTKYFLLSFSILSLFFYARPLYKTSEADRRRLVSSAGRASAGRGATGWLRAIPTQHYLQIPNLHFECAMQFFLHLPLAALVAAPACCHCCQDTALADRWGDHDLSARSWTARVPSERSGSLNHPS